MVKIVYWLGVQGFLEENYSTFFINMEALKRYYAK
jgi:hypothetical protein